MQVFTARYFNRAILGHRAIQTSVVCPEWFHPHAQLHEVTPDGWMLNLPDGEWQKAYRAKLERVGVDAIRKALEAAAAGAESIVLLCYEAVHKGEQCHRREFAKFWFEKTGETIDELAEPAPKPNPQLLLF